MYKTLFFSLLFLIIVGVVGYFAYNLGQGKQIENEVAPTETVVSTINDSQKPTDIMINEPEIEINENTISYVIYQGKIYLKYRNKIYDDSNQSAMEGKEIHDAINYKWVGIVDSPQGVPAGEFMNDEVFGLLSSKDNNTFLFIMRWGVKTGENTQTSYYLYQYNLTKKTNKLSLVNKFDENYKESGYKVPKLESLDASNKYLALKMYGCWNCGGHQPETLLINLDSKQMKNIGKTSYFVWNAAGNYQYKEYVEIPCVGESMGPCSEKADNLPLKSGQF